MQSLECRCFFRGGDGFGVMKRAYRFFPLSTSRSSSSLLHPEACGVPFSLLTPHAVLSSRTQADLLHFIQFLEFGPHLQSSATFCGVYFAC